MCIQEKQKEDENWQIDQWADEGEEITGPSYMQKGQIFGEISVLLKCRRTAGVISDQYSTAAEIDVKEFTQLCINYPMF